MTHLFFFFHLLNSFTFKDLRIVLEHISSQKMTIPCGPVIVEYCQSAKEILEEACSVLERNQLSFYMKGYL